MLRITRNANGDVIFRVSGELNAENLPEIGAVISAEKKGTHIVLDLADLRSVDGEAVTSLERWEAGSIELKNCTAYIREWIRRQRVERQSDQGM
jgi:ABC-type transporter Mla MlaB component